MSSPRTVNCPNPDCRATLKIPDTVKTVRCPRCKTEFAPVEPSPKQEILELAPEPDKQCPECKALMAANAVLCIECGFDLRSGKKLQTKKVKSSRKRSSRDRNSPVTRDNLSEVLEEAEQLIDLAARELRRLPYVLGGDDPDMAALRHRSIPGRCANPNCQMGIEASRLLGGGPREGTSKVTFRARSQTIVVELCEDCTEQCLEDLGSRDKTARGYLRQAREDLRKALKVFPRDEQIESLLKEVRKVELLANAEKPRRRACFIATAAFGSPFAEEVETLRQFRDDVLERSLVGHCFTRLYYLCSPPLAAILARSPHGRAMTRWLLAPVVRWCRRHAHREA
jgi:hypothetical protein